MVSLQSAKQNHYEKLARQFFNYLIVGGIAFIIDFSVLYTLTEFAKVHYALSATAGFMAGLVFNYILCISVIFDYRSLKNKAHEFMIFSTIGLLGLLINNALIVFFTEIFDFHYLISKITTAGSVLMINFTLRRNMLFA